MQTFLVIIACLSIVVAYVAWCLWRDRQADRAHQAVAAALSPGPRIRELTVPGMVRQNPLRARNLAGGSQPAFPSADDFGHVPTDYGTYTPAQVDAEILGRSDLGLHCHHATTCAEAPAPDAGHHVSHHDACPTVDTTYDTSYGGFDGGGHHGH